MLVHFSQKHLQNKCQTMLVHVWKQLRKMLNYVEQLLLSLESKALFESNYRDIPMTTSKNMLKPKLK